MTTLVVGASGATGRLLVQQLLNRGQSVKAVVRSPDSLPEGLAKHPKVTVIPASILSLTEAEVARHVRGCDAVASCLGHNLSLRGMFGPPHRLVTETTRRLCEAIKANQADGAVRFVLMNTTGNRNRDLAEPVSFGQRCVIGILRLLLPPHVDNEKAADYLRVEVGPHDRAIAWVAVRPDNLVNDSDVSRYDVHPSPIRSAIFNPGVTSRINVAHFMAELVADDEVWRRWRGQMPVIYNRSHS